MAAQWQAGKAFVMLTVADFVPRASGAHSCLVNTESVGLLFHCLPSLAGRGQRECRWTGAQWRAAWRGDDVTERWLAPHPNESLALYLGRIS